MFTRIEVGESASHTVVREVAEESGITIELTGLAGVYSDPTHVLVDPDDSIHQQLALCFHAVPRPPSDGDQPRPDDIETNGAAWFSIAEIADLKVYA
ncbi:MAG TPA: NUDIX domain-containing protein, partial [Mycobacterium sp.]|nr:NUDIX domain-containing protein [Mycobacterium sp.]